MKNNDKQFQLYSFFKRNNLGCKLIIGFVLLIFLSLFLHFKQIRVDMLELNSKAPKYIVSQIDFEFPDDEATVALRQRKQADIHSIYFIDKKEIKRLRNEFEEFLMNNQQWEDLTFMPYNKISNIADMFENILIQARFCNNKTLKNIKSFNVDIKNFITLNHKNEEKIVLPKGCFSLITKKIEHNVDSASRDALNFIADYFSNGHYFVRLDPLTKNQVQKIIGRKIPQQFTKIRAGEQIVGIQETVTSRHIAALQAMKAALNQQRNLMQPLTILGNILMSLLFILLSVLYFKIEQPAILKSLKEMSLISAILVLVLISAKIMENFLLKNANFAEIIKYPVIVPLASILFSILFNSRISLFFSSLLLIIFGVNLAIEHSYFLIVNLVTSLIVIISTKSLRKRTEVFGVCSKCMLGVIPVIIFFSFINKTAFNALLFVNIMSSFTFLMIIGIMVVGFLPILESFFDVLTDITLMEYMDPNNELLRRLTLEVPGSYQHSLVLGNLAEAAAQEIKAKALFCRVATLYHDIGKLNNPNYFIENQGTGVNIHQLLMPKESVQVIISHVLDGEILGKKYGLPKQILDIIRQHHGTTLVYYFYRKELEIMGKDTSKVDQNEFRYPGPKPKTKESAIIMIADAVEAASRTLEKISEKILHSLVDNIVKEKAEDGQFDDCSLTFEELKIIKRSIIRTLMLTSHLRIKYPDKQKEKLGFYLKSYCTEKSV